MSHKSGRTSRVMIRVFIIVSGTLGRKSSVKSKRNKAYKGKSMIVKTKKSNTIISRHTIQSSVAKSERDKSKPSKSKNERYDEFKVMICLVLLERVFVFKRSSRDSKHMQSQTNISSMAISSNHD